MATSSSSNVDPHEELKRLASMYDPDAFWDMGRALGFEDETLLSLQEDSSPSKTTVERLMWTWMNSNHADVRKALDILQAKLADFKSDCDATEVSSGVETPKLRNHGAKRWGILVALFFVSFLELGSVRTLSLILDDLTYQFDVSTAYLGAIYGTLSGIYPSLTFINIPLLRHVSVRQLTMMGGAVSSVGLILASFTRTVSQLTAALLSFGVGYIFINLPTFTYLNDYYDDRFEIAAGVMTSGGSIGVMVMPWLFESMLNSYGWRGILLLLGGCNAHYVVIGALLKPIDQRCASGTKTKTTSTENETTYNGHPISGSEPDSDELKGTTTTLAQSDQVLITRKDAGHLDHADDEAMCGRDEKTESEHPSDDCDKAPNCHIHLTEKCCSEAHERVSDVTESSSETEDDEVRLKIGFLENIGRTSNSKTEALHEDNKTRKTHKNYLKTISKSFGLHIFKERPLIILLCIQVYLFSVPYATWLLFTIPNAQAKGLSDLRSTQISVTGGIANFLGRFLGGFIFSKNILRVEVWYLLANMITSVAFFVNFFADSFWFLTLLAAVFGLMMGFNVPTIMVLLKRNTGNEYFQTGFSLINLCYGTSFLFAGYIAGKIYDGTQSYNTAFLIMGGLALAAGITVTLPLWVSRVDAKLSKYSHVQA